jgi:hypothetical protein
MKAVIQMANECGIYEFENNESQAENIMLFHTMTRNATLDEIATKIQAMPFGDTAASFAVWILEQKT